MPEVEDPGMVYLVHLDRAIRHGAGSPKRHYLGHSKDVDKREREHGGARGARFLRQARREGVGFRVVRTWVGGTDLERKLKKRGHAALLCPECVATAKWHKDLGITEEEVKQ